MGGHENGDETVGKLMRWFIFFFSSLLYAQPAVHLVISDTINPGTQDYIESGITAAENSNAAYVLIELDTPGGLLNSTRQIVQRMLNTKVPVVVYIGPKGAQAGSAGAIITLAADVAVMAPGTNIGAAHPVAGGGEKMDKTMSEKITNDTAAFAESLAKTKGRNTEWAKKAVVKSASIIAEEALKLNVIDLIAEDSASLTQRLQGFKLRTPKNGIVSLPASVTTMRHPLSVKQKIVSFFANPNLAYLILSLGALCIWVEVSHPGLVMPGVIGGLCVLVSLVSFQMLPIHAGALLLILLGLCLLIAELFVASFGILGIGGIVSFVLGSLYLIDTDMSEFTISRALIFPTAGTLCFVIAALSYLLLRTRNLQVKTGLGEWVGERAEVREKVTGTSGKVFLHGELWNAVSSNGEEITMNSSVRIKEVRNMLLIVSKEEA